MRKTLIALAVAGFMAGMPAVQASEGHDHGDKHGHDEMKHGDKHAGMDGHKEMSGHEGGHKGGHEGGHKDGHDSHGEKHGHGEGGHDMGAMFLKKKQIDGYTVSFHVMKPADGPSMGGTHHFMIKVEKDGKALDNIVINSKVVYPDGKSDSKKAMKMGGWYMAGYNLKDSGKHQMMILFKTADGKKHKGGVYYP